MALARFLGIVDGVERIVENAGLDHFGGVVGLPKYGVSWWWEVGGRDSQLDTRGEVSTWRNLALAGEQEECPQGRVLELMVGRDCLCAGVDAVRPWWLLLQSRSPAQK